MLNVFISYSRSDGAFARKLATDLGGLGNSVWIDVEDIPPGVTWSNAIQEGLDICEIMILILSPDAMKSTNVQPEWEFFLGEQKTIIPILWKPTAIHYRLKNVQFIDFYTQSYDSAFELLSARLSQLRTKNNISQPTIDVSHTALGLLSVTELIADFHKSYNDRQWYMALECLEAIRRSARVPSYFDPNRYESEIQRELVLENRRAEYDELCALVQKIDPARAWEAFQGFQQTYPGFDPANLDRQVNPARPWLDMIRDPKTPPPERAYAGRRLAWIGDTRFGVGLRSDGLPDIDWVKIPKGKYKFGNSTHFLGTFFISRYPVTFSQFRAFLETADGYSSGSHWEGLAKRESRPSNQRWPIDNHPIERVSWYEAVAFCRWLSVKLGYEIRLPNENEWEKAARGQEGNSFPWGNEYLKGHANINERKNQVGPFWLQRTTAVGIYPQGASPYGVFDMCGNVWEWTLTDSGIRKPRGFEYDKAYVVRGGSWSDEIVHACAAYRSVRLPYHREQNRGFRVVSLKPTM